MMLFFTVWRELQFSGSHVSDILATKSLRTDATVPFPFPFHLTKRVDIHERYSLLCEENELLLRQNRLLKKEVEYLETTTTQDLARLDTRLKDAAERYEENLRKEIDIVRKVKDDEIHGLMKELTQLEHTNAELKVQLDRAAREKRSAENELEKVTQLNLQQNEKNIFTIEELGVKIRTYERERDMAINNLERLQGRLSRAEESLESAKMTSSAQIDQLQQKVRRTAKMLEESNDERIKLLNKVAEQEKNLKQLQTSHDQKHRSEQQWKSKYEELSSQTTIKIQELGDAIQKKEAALTDVTNKFQKVSQEFDETYRTRTEYESLAEQNSSAIRRLKESLREKEAEINDLTQQCHYLTTANAELSQQVAEERKSHAQMHVLIRNTEMKAQAMSQHVEQLLSKQNELLSERAALQRSVDRLKMENDRIRRDLADPSNYKQSLDDHILTLKNSIREQQPAK